MDQTRSGGEIIAPEQCVIFAVTPDAIIASSIPNDCRRCVSPRNISSESSKATPNSSGKATSGCAQWGRDLCVPISFSCPGAVAMPTWSSAGRTTNSFVAHIAGREGAIANRLSNPSAIPRRTNLYLEPFWDCTAPHYIFVITRASLFYIFVMRGPGHREPLQDFTLPTLPASPGRNSCPRVFRFARRNDRVLKGAPPKARNGWRR